MIDQQQLEMATKKVQEERLKHQYCVDCKHCKYERMLGGGISEYYCYSPNYARRDMVTGKVTPMLCYHIREASPHCPVYENR